jgi:serine/threonine-protein kinase
MNDGLSLVTGSLMESPAGEDDQGSPLPAGGPMPGQLGRYEIHRLIGRGSMGMVWLGNDPLIDRPVAIKLIHTSALRPAELKNYTERFYREARAAGKLLHPGIVTVFDVGHAPGGAPFIVMEFVEGQTLRELFKTRNLEREEVVAFCSQILEALGYAHGRGVVHRDLKPANILITPEGQSKIMDFGIAHVVGSDLTEAGELLGSPYYMAPEQFEPQASVDPRTDLFAFGVVLYEMLTGERPFAGDSIARIAKAILHEEPAPPEQRDGTIPPVLNAIVLRCLRKDPMARFGTAQEVSRALSSFGPARPGEETTFLSAARSASPPEELEPLRVNETAPTTPSGRKPLAARKPRPMAVFAALSPVALLSLLLWSRSTGGGGPDTSPLPGEPTPVGSRPGSEPVTADQAPGPTESAPPVAPIETRTEDVPLVGDTSQRLPRSWSARHKHRIGVCTGTLTLAEGEIRFESAAHGRWQWKLTHVVSMSSEHQWHFAIQTTDDEALRVGSRKILKLREDKNFNFSLESAPMSRPFWNGYQRLWRDST